VLELSTPIKFVKRVGERVAVELAKRGVETVEDLLYHLPFRYEDRLNPVPMSALQAGTMASVIGEVRGSVLLQTRHMPLFEMTVGQGLNTVKCMWFRGTYLRDKFHVGQMVALYGKLEPSRSSAGKFKMIQPQFEILPAHGGPDAEYSMLEVGRIVPVYESLGGTTAWGAKLGSKWLRRVIWGLFEELEAGGASGLHPTLRDEAAKDGAPDQLYGAPSLGAQLTFGAKTDRLNELSLALAALYAESGTSGIIRGSNPGFVVNARQQGGSGQAQSSQVDDLAENTLLALVRTGVENDFERVVFPAYPSLREIKRQLMGTGSGAALYAALSGSGSALFGLYRSEQDARAAQQRVLDTGRDAGTKALITKTLPRSAYWTRMFAG